MSYPEIDKNEKTQIEEVFRLGGGELSDKPLRYAICKVLDSAKVWGTLIDIERRWARYFYDGAPSYIEREWARKFDGTFLTIVTCEMFGEMPKRIMTSDGRVWRKVRTFRSSGETECPWQGVAEEDRPDPQTWEGDCCPLCEEGKGEEHGMIYIGEGWAEVVYRTRS
jgi:hypothetical protein